MTRTDTVQRLTELLAAPVDALGLDLEEIEVTPAGKRRIVRVAVDQDGGVTLDDVAAATRAVSKALDDAEGGGGAGPLGNQPYTLEVSSRGVDRPLTLPRHWRRNADRLVKVTLAGGEQVTGRIVSVEDLGGGGVVARVREGDSGDAVVREIPLDDVRKAKVQVEFNAHRSG